MERTMPANRRFICSFYCRLRQSVLLTTLGLCVGSASAQVNSGSNGSDGAFSPTHSVTIDMADHPDGIYQYTSVNIPSGVTVNFRPNAANSPVIWLVQQNCIIAGNVSVSGVSGNGGTGGTGGPGGWIGGSAGNPNSQPGQGPGGGIGASDPNSNGASGTGGSFATLGSGANPGPTYGNDYLLPLLGGSGGGGAYYQNPYLGAHVFDGGGGGGGAILVAASSNVQISGSVSANGGQSGSGGPGWSQGGPGSGGGIRIVATSLSGGGSVSATSGSGGSVGSGRVRFDVYNSTFGGSVSGVLTTGFQSIIIPGSGQGVQLAVTSVGGTAAPSIPTGVLTNPDVIVPAQRNNPLSIVVSCTNVPLNTAITVVAHPSTGSDVQTVGVNNVGTVASSTATVSMNLPQGGGIIYANCLSGTVKSTSSTTNQNNPSYAKSGLTTDGELISDIEVVSEADGQQQTVYKTPSGKRLIVANK